MWTMAPTVESIPVTVKPAPLQRLPMFGTPAQRVVPAAGGNCAICPYFTENPAAVHPICSGRNQLDAWSRCSIVEAANPSPASDSPCTGRGDPTAGCAVRCGSRIDIHRWVDVVGGSFVFDDVHLGTPPIPELPRFIPGTRTSLAETMQRRIQWPAFAQTLRRVITRSIDATEELRYQSRWERDGAHANLGIDPATQKAVLLGYGPDDVLERFWSRRTVDRLVERLASMNFDVATSPDFSVFADQPRTEHLLNMKRSLIVASEMADAGIPTAPAFYWFRREDIDRWLRWVEDNDPPLVFLPAHTLRGGEEWRTMAAPGMRYIGQRLDELEVSARVLVSGVSSTPRVAQLGQWFGRRLHTTSQNPLHLAMQGQVATSEGRKRTKAHRADLFASSVAHYDQQVRDAIAGRLPLDGADDE